MKSITLDKRTMFNDFTIWQPRWHDKRVLLAKRKIGEHNRVKITQEHADGTKYFPNDMYISGREAKKYKVESNGTIDCICVPLEKLSVLELTKNSIYELY